MASFPSLEFPVTDFVSLWIRLPREERQEAALAFLRNENEPHPEARLGVCIHRQRGFRPERLQRMRPEELARHFSAIPRPPASLCDDLLRALFLGPRRALLFDLLDALGLPHQDGLLEREDELEPVSLERARDALGELEDHDLAGLLPVLAGALALQKPKIHGALLQALEGSESSGVEAPEDAEEAAPPAEDLEESLELLDRLLIRTVVAAVAGETGGLDLEQAEELVDSVVHLNISRHPSYFHRGFLDGLLDRPDIPDLAENNLERLAWLAAGWLSARARRQDRDAILAFLEHRRRELRPLLHGRHPAIPYGLPALLQALVEGGRSTEIPGLVDAEALSHCGRGIHHLLLEAATRQLREERHEEAALLLDRLLSALELRRLRGEDVPQVLLDDTRRRRAHAYRLRGAFDHAQGILKGLQERGNPWTRSQVLADLGLVAARIRSLAHLRFPEDGDLGALAGDLEAGREWFERSIEVHPRQSGHGAWCLGLILLGHALHQQDSAGAEEALPWLERAIATFSARPEVYRPGRILPRAQLALGRTLTFSMARPRARQARECLVAGIEGLGREAFPLALEGLLELTALSRQEAREVARALVQATAEETDLRHRLLDEILKRDEEFFSASTELVEALRERALGSGRSRPERLGDLERLLVLAERRDDRQLADQALDQLQVMAWESPGQAAFQTFCRILADSDLASTGWEPEEILEARAAVHRQVGEHGEAAALLERLAFTTLSGAEPRPEDAEDLVAEIQTLSVAGYPSPALLQRLASVRAAGPDALAETEEPGIPAGRILFLGGNEVQRRYQEAVRAEMEAEFPEVHVDFVLTGWKRNWGRQLDLLENRVQGAGAVVLMRFMRTQLGRRTRKLCGEYQVPWVACTGHGRDSILRSLRRAARLLPKTAAAT